MRNTAAISFLFLAAAALAISAPANALGGGGGGGGGSSTSSRASNQVYADFEIDNGEASGTMSSYEPLDVADDHPRVVVLPAVVAPLADGTRLLGYAYLNARMLIAEGENATRIQEEAHFALDAIVRASHSSHFTNENGNGVDLDTARAVWLEALAGHYGDGVIQQVSFMNPDIRLIRQ